MPMQILRILTVDDYEPFRRFLEMTLRQRADFQIIGEAADGLEAIHKAKELQLDLILLDIGLPNLNGIEVGKMAYSVAPRARILFVSQESDTEIIQKTLRLGAQGYIHKSQVARDLLPAINAVLAGKKFVSGSLAYSNVHRHEVVFCSGEKALLDALALSPTQTSHRSKLRPSFAGSPDGQSDGRCSTAHHARYRAVPHTNRTL